MTLQSVCKRTASGPGLVSPRGQGNVRKLHVVLVPRSVTMLPSRLHFANAIFENFND